MVSFDDATSVPIMPIHATNYATKLLEKFSSMRDKPDLCDFRIDINNEHLYCHKFLLMATSDYFKVLFNGLSKKEFFCKRKYFLFVSIKVI